MIDREKYKQTTRYQFYALAAFGFVMILWSVLFEIDIISNAEGQIIPLGEVKTIQHLEGGIIDQILVKESELVKKGQPLVILAATASEVEVDEVKVQIDAQIIKSIRIEAEINNFDIPIFPDELVNERPDLVNKSMELFISKRDKYNGDINEIEAVIEQHQTSVDILLRQAEMSSQLLEEKVTNEYAHLNVLKELNAAKGQLEESIEKKENITNDFVQNARNELQVAQRDLSELNETIKALNDNLDRTSINAPVEGIVKNLFFVTEGGVIRPGEAILDLVPTRDSLIVEARLQDSDIGFVQVGQSAVVKLSSADSVNFGQLNGIVTQISPDTEEDENDNRIVFYKILLETDKNYFESNDKIYQLVPGVKVNASIHIGQRTVANYLLSPFIDSMDGTFQER
ncbi:MAG: HlyD family type I secretion periplasmic adaptor subunit [Candidatus Pelagibacterales bacterium]|jgi:adhesin transport system membrane fusion protein